jgi:hypothetical protein
MTCKTTPRSPGCPCETCRTARLSDLLDRTPPPRWRRLGVGMEMTFQFPRGTKSQDRHEFMHFFADLMAHDYPNLRVTITGLATCVAF